MEGIIGGVIWKISWWHSKAAYGKVQIWAKWLRLSLMQSQMQIRAVFLLTITENYINKWWFESKHHSEVEQTVNVSVICLFSYAKYSEKPLDYYEVMLARSMKWRRSLQYIIMVYSALRCLCNFVAFSRIINKKHTAPSAANTGLFLYSVSKCRRLYRNHLVELNMCNKSLWLHMNQGAFPTKSFTLSLAC